MKHLFIQTVLTITLIFSGFFFIESTNAQEFRDVPTDHIHANNIQRLADLNIINGYGNGYFGVDDPILREHAVLLMYKMLKDEKHIVRQYKPFDDVTVTNPNFEAISWAYKTGIIDGNEGKFHPSDYITRQEMAKILVTAFNLSSRGNNTIRDVDQSSWAYPYINTLTNLNLTHLYENTFNPLGHTKRSEMASFLVRSADYKGIQLKTYVAPAPPSTSGPEYDTKQVFESGWNMKWHVWESDKTLHLYGYNANNQLVGQFVKGPGKSLANISIGMSKAEVERMTGDSLPSSIEYKNGYMRVNYKADQLIFSSGSQYVTVFFDVHNDYKVTGILAIESALYKAKPFYYPASSNLQENYEDLMVVLINQSRKEFGLPKLNNLNDEWNFIVRAHSQDMINRNYFDHNTPEGITFGQRLTRGDVSYMMAGENLVYGSETIIHGHEALMNSKGHRNNILHDGFENVIVGVQFDSSNRLYATINKFSLFNR